MATNRTNNNDGTFVAVGYEVDQRSVEQAVKAYQTPALAARSAGEEFEAFFNTLQRESTASTRIFRLSSDMLNQELGELRGEFASLRAEWDAYEADLRDLTEGEQFYTETIEAETRALRENEQAAERASRAKGTPTGGNRRPVVTPTTAGAEARDRLGDVDRFGSFGTQIAGAFGNSDIANAVGLIGDLGGGIEQLGVVGIVGVAALGAITLAQAEYNRIVDIGRRNLEGALNAQDAYYSALETMTSDQAREDIAARQRSNVLLQERIATLDNAINSAFQQAQAQFGDVIARALEAGGQLPTAGLREQLNELQTEFSTNEQTIGLLTQGLEDNRFALNDSIESTKAAADAERELADERRAIQQEILQGAEEEARTRRERQNLLRSGTSSELERAIEETRLQSDIIQAQVRAADASGEFTYGQVQVLIRQAESIRIWRNRLIATLEDRRYQESLGSLPDFIQTFIGRVQDVVPQVLDAAREKVEKALDAFNEQRTQQNEQYLDAVDLTVSAQEELTKVQQEYADTQAASAERVKSINDDLTNQLGDIQQQRRDDTLEREIELNNRLADIADKRLAGETAASQARNVIAFDQAKTAAEEAAKEAQKQDTRTADREERNYQRSEQRARSAAERNTQIEIRRAEDELRVKGQAVQKAQAALQSAQLAEMTMYLYHFGGLQNIVSTGWTFIRGVFEDGMNALFGSASGAGSAVGGQVVGARTFPTLTSTIGSSYSPSTLPAEKLGKDLGKSTSIGLYAQLEAFARGYQRTVTEF